MFEVKDISGDDLIARCMHCALCLPTCPTYALTGLEKSSPRGRIRLMKAVAAGELGITDEFVKEMNFCLDCKACETACPAGVEYGRLVEAARVGISNARYGSWLYRLARSFLLKWLFDAPERLRILARPLRLFQVSGLQKLVGRTKVLRLFSRTLDNALPLTPKISKRPSSSILHSGHLSSSSPKHRVGFLTGCVMDIAFAEANVDTVELLLRHDCEVIVPPGQGCCGSLQAHNGDAETASEFARRNIDVFFGLNLDAIVMNSAGCGAFMKQYGEVLRGDPEYTAPAAAVAGKVKDLSEFLVEIGPKIPAGSRHRYRSQRVTYHDACHLVHAQRISRQPRELIRQVPGIEFIELPEADWCCGSAGVYNITHHEAAMNLLQRKLDNIKSVKPDIVVTSNPGCLIQLSYGIVQEGLHCEVLHLATFLRRVCDA